MKADPSGPLSECLSEALVSEYLEGQLGEGDRRRVLEHASQCGECGELLACLRAAQSPEPASAEAGALLKAFTRSSGTSGRLLAGKYRLGQRLGRGGMGVVYEAVNTWTDRRVAVKLLHPWFFFDPEIVSRFQREAKSATRVLHPSIVDVLDLGQDPGDGTFYMVQEFLTGETLRQRIIAKPRHPLAEAAAILTPIMEALAAAHDAGVVHRDVKPENIMISVDHYGEALPKLIDFGLSKITLAEVAPRLQTGHPLGTPEYMSPERLRGDEQIEQCADMWAIGVVLFELLAGRRPFEAASHPEVMAQILTSDAPSVKSFAPDLPDGVAALLSRALRRDEKARYPNIRVMLNDFVLAAAIEPGAIQPVGRRRPRWVAHAVGLGVLAGMMSGHAVAPRPLVPMAAATPISATATTPARVLVVAQPQAAAPPVAAPAEAAPPASAADPPRVRVRRALHRLSKVSASAPLSARAEASIPPAGAKWPPMLEP